MPYESNNTNSSISAFLVGALAGVAAVLFLDKDMRAKVGNKLLEAKAYGEDQLSTAKEKAVEARDTAVRKTDEMLLEAHERLGENMPASGSKSTAKKS